MSSVFILELCILCMHMHMFLLQEENKITTVLSVFKNCCILEPPFKTMSQPVFRQMAKYGWKIYCNGEKP